MTRPEDKLQADFEVAAANHNFAKLLTLVKCGGSANALVGGRPLLIYAATQGQIPLAQQLIEAGANVDGADGEGNTALMYAGRLALPEMVLALLDCGADALARNQAGRTARDEMREARVAFERAADDAYQTMEDIENTCARFGRVALLLVEAEIEASKQREILSCHTGIASDITVRKPIAFKS